MVAQPRVGLVEHAPATSPYPTVRSRYDAAADSEFGRRPSLNDLKIVSEVVYMSI